MTYTDDDAGAPVGPGGPTEPGDGGHDGPGAGGLLTEIPTTGLPAEGPSAVGPSSAGSSAAPSPGAQREDEILYPPQRGQEVLARAGKWWAERFAALSQFESIVTLVVVAACVVFVFVQFGPSMLFLNTTISGGDTGAHVLMPWVLMHQVLPHFRLEGWTTSNWDGFPAPDFYFPLPMYTIVGLSQLIGYNVAFKLVTAAPMVLMPVAAWLMGRLARAPFPVPAVMAVGTLPFMFGNEFSIYGGNILSTMAGEFSFAWSLCFAMVFVGLVIGGLQTGRRRAVAAVVLACALMCHIIPFLFATAVGLYVVLAHAWRNRDWQGALRWFVPTAVAGVLVTAWWSLPFKERWPYVTDMGYTRTTNYIATLFPPKDTWLFILAALGAGLSLARRRRMGELWAVVAVVSAITFRYEPQSILWNARFEPFWFLSLYMLAALAVAEIYAMLAERWTSFAVTFRAASLPGPLLVLILGLTWVGFPLGILPGEHQVNGQNEFLGMTMAQNTEDLTWMSWNYSGYQYSCTATTPHCDTADVKSGWPEYVDIVNTLQNKLKPKYGCGNVMWEYNSSMNRYGTTDALTILPYWTKGCFGSMEGLYYESSATTPFHFIDQSELSVAPSDPMVGLPYANAANVALGVQHLQMLGVKYYMAMSPALQQQAAADPSLKLVARIGPYNVNNGSNQGSTSSELYWDFYLIKDAPRVHALANRPVVMAGLNNSSQQKWLQEMTSWYDDPSAWGIYVAATGPSSWQRVPYLATNFKVHAEPATTVSHIVEKDTSISFDVSRTGVPVVVTESYFPNWQVNGAKGVYRVSPNLMAVVPTSHHVTLYYGTTAVDYEGWLLSLIGIASVVVLSRLPAAKMAAQRRPALGRRRWRPWWPAVQGSTATPGPFQPVAAGGYPAVGQQPFGEQQPFVGEATPAGPSSEQSSSSEPTEVGSGLPHDEDWRPGGDQGWSPTGTERLGLGQPRHLRTGLGAAGTGGHDEGLRDPGADPPGPQEQGPDGGSPYGAGFS
ncbi:MAG TPA: hypothetical protein VFN61_10835 [Acidimicrobiales bacterium]|nr:hypothetical protein [Acidimicrobiales bacterium]